MARKFYTPISLTGLELTNFKIQNLPDNPAPYGAGHSYYNTVAKELRIYDGTNWVPVGGSVEYGTYAALPTPGNNGRVYATTDTQTLYLDYSGSWLQIGASGSASYVNSVNGTSNQISVNNTTGDVTVSLPSYIDVPNGELHVRKTEYWKDGDQYGIVTANPYTAGEFAIVAINNLALESNNGNIKIEPSTTLTIFNGNLTINGDGGIITTDVNSLHLTANNGTVTTDTSEFHTTKVELWKDGDTTGSRLGIIVAHPSDGSLSIAASNQLVLEAHSGEINLAPSNGVINGNNNEMHLRKTEYWYGGDNGGTQEGIVAAISDGTFHVTATNNNLVLESNNGWVTLQGDSGVKSLSNFYSDNGYSITSGNNLYVKNGIYAGGTDTGTDGYVYVQDASGNNLIGLSGTSGSGVIETHGVVNLYRGYGDGGTEYGQFFSDGDNNLIINASDNNLILQADSSRAYIGSVTDGNRVATMSDVNAAAQGLYVLGSVRTATGSNIDITANASTPISGVTLVNGDRVLVKSQTTATENGIYIYSSDSQTLVPSTNAVDADIKEGSYTLVEEGTYAAQGWIVTAFTAGASTWTQFSAAGEYTAGNGISIDGGSISVKLDSDSLSESGSGLKVNYHTDGGLDNDSGLYVKTANGVKIDNSGNVTIDTTIVARRYASTITPVTPFTDNDFTFNHGLGTDVIVQVWDTYSNGGANQLVDVDYYNITDNGGTTVVEFAVPPTDGQVYRVVVVG